MNKQLVSFSALALGLCSTAALAQATQSSTTPARPVTNVLEEVVVTAEHRSENVQKAAIAITVLSGDALGEKGFGSAKDLINAVPGIALTQTTPIGNLSLRGVGSGGGNAYSDPTVAFNLDGVNVARQFTTAGSFYDLQRVEILKGPQGTLYGRNATVGALNVVPNRPGFKYEGSVGLDFGNYKSFGTTGMINVPLSDTVAMRLAFKTDKHDGYMSNGYNDADKRAARIGLLIQPDRNWSTFFSADYFHDGGKGPTTVFLYPNNTSDKWQDGGNPWLAFSIPPCGSVQLCPTFGNTSQAPATLLPSIAAMPVIGSDGFVNNEQVVVKNETQWNLGLGTLTVIPAYVHSKIDFNSYAQGFQQVVKNNVGQTSLEARLASNEAGPWKWLTGAYFFTESQDSTGNFLEARGYSTVRGPNIDDKSYALFGQTTYSVTDKFRVTGGLRYTRESKSQDGFTTLTNTPNPCTPAVIAVGGVILPAGPLLPAGGCSVPNGGDLSFNSTNFKVGVEYDVAPQSLLYADVSSGFKAGGFWGGLPPNTYKPEKLTAYAIGSKNRFFENRLQANLELFYWDYKDQQVNVTTAILPAGNTGRPFNTDGYIAGTEMDFVFLATDNDRLTLDLLLEDGKYKAFPLSATVLTQPVNNFAIDLPRTNTPHASLTASYEHTFDLSNGASLAFTVRTHWQSSTWLSALANPAQLGQVLHLDGAAQPAYHLSNLGLSYYEPRGKWQVTGFVDNVENEAVVYTGTSGLVSRGLVYRPANNNALYAALNAPRTYGVRLSAKF